MPVSDYVRKKMEAGSWIRKMFETGARLKTQFGADKVFDLTLGNPVMEPPAQFFDALREVSEERGSGRHRYMPNAGFPDVREKIAAHLTEKGILPTDASRVIMSVGAGGGLNVVLKTILNPGEEVILLAPFFVEYVYYVENHGGVPVVVQTDETFDLDLDAIERAITPKTRAIFLNSPNNPTGRIYPREKLDGLIRILEKKSKENGSPVYLVSDEPYREIVYDGHRLPNFLGNYKNSLLVYSWSKSLSIPGERIGYVAVHRDVEDRTLPDGLTFATRILGFVNAPATMQLAAARLLDVTVDIAQYRVCRDILTDGLKKAGYDVVEPEGAFYLFPAIPKELETNDMGFVKMAQEEFVLVVPGSGFGRPGHFRLSYCVEQRLVEGAVKGLARVLEKKRSASEA